MTDRKKKILIVFHSENLQSGATRSLMDIVNYLIITEKYEIEAIFPKPDGSAKKYLQNLGIKTHVYQYGGLMQNLTQPLLKRVIKFPFLCVRMLKIKKAAKQAAKDFDGKGVDLVYSNTSSIIFGGLLGNNLGCRQAWHIREFRKLDHRIAFFLGDKYLMRFINRCSDVVMFVSKSVRDMHKGLIDEDKMVVTYNSYTESFIRPRENFNTDGTLRVMIAGDIKPSKGQFDCVKAVELAMKKVPKANFVLHLAGRKSNENYYNEMCSYIDSHKLNDSVVLHGQVEDMISLREQTDVGIVASTNEAFGRTTIEGMLSMMTMIGRNSGGTAEQIRHNETGILYDGTVEDLADKLLLLYNDRALMRRLAKNGFEESVELHTKGRCAQIADEALSKVLQM